MQLLECEAKNYFYHYRHYRYLNNNDQSAVLRAGEYRFFFIQKRI